MNRSIIASTFLIVLLSIACGGGDSQPNSLEGKKEQLKTLQKEQQTLNQQIQTLEQEIVALDPASAKTVKKITVATETLALQDFKHFVQVQGKVESNKNIVVSPQVGGIMTQLLVREGQQVRAGQTMARIDDAVMKRSIAEVQTSLDLADIMFNKQKNLWDQEIGTEVQFLTAKSQKESLERRLATLEEQWAMTQIKAPISGAVDEIMPKVGETVSPGMPAIRIVNVSDLSLKADLSEVYIPYIKRGDQVNIKFPTLDKEIKAKVTAVGQSIDPSSRTFNVEARLPRDPHVKPNMFGELAINDRSFTDAVVVPMNVVQSAEGGSFVYVAEQNAEGAWVAKRKGIKTKLSQDGRALVESGLSEGDRLITVGFKDLSENQEIEFEVKPPAAVETTASVN